jgi:negative regulator of sigma E activity
VSPRPVSPEPAGDPEPAVSSGPHLDDGRLSALIDGEAPAGDLEHATACPECGARVAAWQETRRLVAAAPEAPPAERREAALAAALAEAGQAVTPVASLPDRRGRLARWARGALAVAAVLALAGVVAGVTHTGGSNNNARSSSAGAGTTAGQASGPSTGSPSTGSQPVAHLSAVDGPEPLVASLRSALSRPSTGQSTPGTATAGSDAAVEACLRPAAADAHLPGGTRPALEASLTYRGTLAGTFVFDSGSQHVAVVLAEAGCRLLADVTF